MKAILIDDEQIALDVIHIFLEEIGGVKVVGKYQKVKDALAEAIVLQPDLIFLDIEMPELNGLAAAELFKRSCPVAEIIFITAHANYAIDAYDREALAYLLKPLDKQRLAKTIERASMVLAGRSNSVDASRENQPASELSTVPAAGSLSKRLMLKTLGSLELYTDEGKLLTWRTKKTKELFAYLWHNQGNPVYKYAIMDELWREYSAQQAQRLFHTTLYYLRSMFKSEGVAGLVFYGDDRYWIDLSIMSSDLEQLDSFQYEANQPMRKLEKLLSLYGGDYFEKEHYPWAMASALKIHADYVDRLLTIRASASTEQRTIILYKLIELEPYHEVYYDELIECLVNAGEHNGAKHIHRLKEKMKMEG